MNYSMYTCTTLTVLSEYSQYNLPARARKSLASELSANSETLHALRWPLMSLEHSAILTHWSLAGLSGLALQSPPTYFEYPHDAIVPQKKWGGGKEESPGSDANMIWTNSLSLFYNNLLSLLKWTFSGKNWDKVYCWHLSIVLCEWRVLAGCKWPKEWEKRNSEIKQQQQQQQPKKNQLINKSKLATKAWSIGSEWNRLSSFISCHSFSVYFSLWTFVLGKTLISNTA